MSENKSNRTVPVSELMTREVSALGSGASLDDMAQLLVDEHCHHVPIIDDDRLVGMVSSRDMVRAYRDDGRAAASAADVMSRDLETIYQDQPIDAAIERIGKGDIHSLIVLDHDDRLVGIVTHRDLLRFLMI